MKRLRPLVPPLLAALAACVSPGAAESSDTASRHVRLLESARFGAFAATPTKVVEDSRCAVGVQCIQAGTVRIEARLRSDAGERDGVLSLGVPLDLGGAWVSLTRVCPYPVHGSPIRASDYRFTLVLATGGSPPLIDSAGCPPL